MPGPTPPPTFGADVGDYWPAFITTCPYTGGTGDVLPKRNQELATLWTALMPRLVVAMTICERSAGRDILSAELGIWHWRQDGAVPESLGASHAEGYCHCIR